MIRQTFNVEDYWKIIIYYDVDYNYFGDAIKKLRQAGASWEGIKMIFDEMKSGDAKAVTYSNLNKNISIMILNKHSSDPDLLNTAVHEAEHVKQAMLEAYEVSDKGEKPAYTIGYLISRMWQALRLIMQNPYKS